MDQILDNKNLNCSDYLIKVSDLYKEIEDGINTYNTTKSYPYYDDYDVETKLERVNLEKKREESLVMRTGFVVAPFRKIEKELKSEYGIYSPAFGNTLKDLNLWMDKFRCDCGKTRGVLNRGDKCPHCGDTVIYRGDNYKITGWLILHDYRILTPAAYRSVAALCGNTTLLNMLKFYGPVDEDGHLKSLDNDEFYQKKISGKKPEPFFGIGVIEFQKRFDEIIEYYATHATNKEAKRAIYEDILTFRDRAFTNSIPVYTTLLRPYDLNTNKKFNYEDTNSIYTMMTKLVTRINSKRLRMDKNKKKKEGFLYDLIEKWIELDSEINNILSGKKGKIRQLFCGRYTFSARDVIVQNPKLRIDEVQLPYKVLHELLRPRIINVLKLTYGLLPNQAYDIWNAAKLEPTPTIVKIINNLIKVTDRGLPILINRNPTICLGGILQMFVVGMSDEIDENFNIVSDESVMEVPLQILDLMAADFDGDVENIYLISNKAFFMRAFQIINPANNMYISPNDGLLNFDVMHQRDTMINLNTFVNLGRNHYTQEQLVQIDRALHYPEPLVNISA